VVVVDQCCTCILYLPLKHDLSRVMADDKFACTVLPAGSAARMAAAVTQLSLDHSGSQLLSSTHWDVCSSDELCSDASSGTSSKQVLKPNWQFQVKHACSTGSSTQTQAPLGCLALHQPQYPLLQLPGAAGSDDQDHQQQCSSTPPTTPGGLPAPAARYLKLSCEVLAGTDACPTTEGPETPCPRPAVAGEAMEQAASGSESRKQLQQWLARHEASAMMKTAAGATRRSSDSSSETAAAEGPLLPGPAFELVQALPQPAFFILGVLG
jgi:hypothetical protein